MRTIRRVAAIALATLVLAPVSIAQSESEEVLQSLLSEVRALRVAMQKTNLLGLRGNLLVERIRTAQSRATSTQDQLDRVRQQITTMEQEKDRFTTRIDELEEKIGREYDAEIVEQLKQELDQYKNVTGMFSNQVEGFRRNEVELLSRLDEERARLDGLEAQFDDLLREIEKALEEQ